MQRTTASMRLALVLTLVVLATALGPTPAFAGSGDEDGSTHRFAIGATLEWFDYFERFEGDDGLKSDEQGVVPGVTALWQWHTSIDLVVAAELGFRRGSTRYDGTLLDATPLVDRTKNRFVEAEATLGWDFAPTLAWPVLVEATLYAGLGYRFWERELGGPNPFREFYQWGHVPFGLRVGLQTNDRVRFDIDVAGLAMFYGDIEFQLDDIDPAFNSPHASLGTRPGSRTRLVARIALFEQLEITLRPWWIYSEIGQSDVAVVTQNGEPVLNIIEPHSDTHRVGLDMLVGVMFD